MKDELKGKQPLSKFLAIKMIVFFVFYQGFVFGLLQDYNIVSPSPPQAHLRLEPIRLRPIRLDSFASHCCLPLASTDQSDRVLDGHKRRRRPERGHIAVSTVCLSAEPRSGLIRHWS